MSNIQWYSYADIQFRKDDFQFCLDHLVMIRDGNWPPEHRETGYIGSSGRHISSEANFCKPARIFSEVTLRLEHCGRDGWLTIGYYMGQVDMVWLLKYSGEVESEVHRAMNRATNYSASGACRRWEPCGKCLSIETCHRDREKRKILTYQEWLVTRHLKRKVAVG